MGNLMLFDLNNGGMFKGVFLFVVGVWIFFFEGLL